MLSRFVLTIVLLVIMIVATLVIIVLISKPIILFNPNSPENSIEVSPLDEKKPYVYPSYMLSASPVDLLTYDECAKLKVAVKNAILTGKPYMVDEIAYGSSLDGEIAFPLIGDCAPEVLTTQITKGLDQTVCSFEAINTNSLTEIESYGGISDSASLSYDNCIYQYNKYEALQDFGSGTVIGPSTEDVNLNPNTINLFYSPDYLYFKNGDYAHSEHSLSSINNVTAFSQTAKNGPGRLRIYVGKANVVDGKCRFNVYLCPRPAIAKEASDKTLEIFDRMKSLEILGSLDMPFYIRNMSEKVYKMGDYSKDALYWNFYDIKLDDNYRVETIINAIKAGLQMSALSKGFFAHPHWDVSKDNKISMYYVSDRIGITLAVRQGFGTICAIVSGQPDQCTSDCMVARFNKGDKVRFLATKNVGNNFLRMEGSGGVSPLNDITVNSVQTDGYVEAYFDGTALTPLAPNSIVGYLGIKEGQGSVCANSQCTSRCTMTTFGLNDLVTLNAVADTSNGYKFIFYEGVGGGYTSNNPVDYMSTINHSVIYATFSNDKNGECWSSGYDDTMASSSYWDRTHSIRFNCGDDNICSDTLRVKVAVRRDFRSDINWDETDNQKEELTYISSIVSFCDT